MKKVLKFFSKVCAPCRLMGKRLEELNNVEIISIDINDPNNAELVKKYEVRSVPTIIILDENHNTFNKLIGVVTTDKLKEAINE
jgi:thiol-disulfide isomerase/thioredoxin